MGNVTESFPCPQCRGQCQVLALCPKYVDGTPAGERKVAQMVCCPLCEGHGEISDERAYLLEQGAILKRLRTHNGLGLRECAELLKAPPGLRPATHAAGCTSRLPRTGCGDTLKRMT